MTYARELLATIDSDIATIHADHIARQKLWMPTELLLEHFVPEDVPPEVTAMLVLNLLTEDGLPYFLSLITTHLGHEGAIFDWSKTWTAEEDRHGAAIKQYLQKSLPRQQFIAVERLQYSYLSSGFWPDWRLDPLKLFAYVVLQEKATQVSHHGIADRAKDFDPTLSKMLKRIGAEENKHHTVYFKFFELILAIDPSAAVLALFSVVRSFDMPGKSIKEFAMFERLQAQQRVFGPSEFANIIEDVFLRMNLARLTGLSPDAEQARDGIVSTVKVLRRIAGRKQHDTGPFEFSFLPTAFRL